MKKTNKKQQPTAIVLLDLVDDMFMNVSGEKATAIIHKLVKMLTEDSIWLDKWITQKDARILRNTLKHKAKF